MELDDRFNELRRLLRADKERADRQHAEDLEVEAEARARREAAITDAYRVKQVVLNATGHMTSLLAETDHELHLHDRTGRRKKGQILRFTLVMDHPGLKDRTDRLEVVLTEEGKVDMAFGTWEAGNGGTATVNHSDFNDEVMAEWIAKFVKQQIRV